MPWLMLQCLAVIAGSAHFQGSVEVAWRWPLAFGVLMFSSSFNVGELFDGTTRGLADFLEDFDLSRKGMLWHDVKDDPAQPRGKSHQVGR